ncbi:unnamed protein product [Echinostoma caproni]|uniref:Septin-type G domain-containing protein n=1 Tax=Echinostoma caproni TaxID=27848 RepID=A0A183A965_9TREM|nr:unnamed protein product [Echinostoma caproni]
MVCVKTKPSGTLPDESKTYRTNQSSQTNRAQQWRQAYRGSQSTTCVSPRELEDLPALSKLTTPPVSPDELPRSPRQLPAQPFRKSAVNLFRATNSPSEHCLSEHGSSDSLRPPQIAHVHRASSFDGRLRTTGPSDTTDSPIHQRPRRTCSSHSSSIQQANPISFPLNQLQAQTREKTIPTTLARSDLIGRRERLVVAPSIEISLAGDCSSSSSEDLHSSNNEPLDEDSRRKLSQVSVGKLVESHSDSQMSGSRALPRSNTQYPSQGRGTPELSQTPRNLNRPKLTRQPRSFQAEPFNNRFQSSDNRGPNQLMDEFDYFCQIANSPSGSREPMGSSKSSNQSGSLSPARHHLATMRSHSMRNTSPETPPPDNKNSEFGAFKSTRNSGEPAKPGYLRPPARGQLRRASTEEERFKQPPRDRTPVSATLSYSPVNASVQNVCRSPPKTVPQLPVFPAPSSPSPGVPIGMPITEDSLFADEPGMTFYQVQVLGSVGVGKTSLCQQLSRLKTGKSEIYDLDDEENRPASHSVTAALRGSVYTVNFIDTSAESFEENLEIQVHDCVDAFIVMYAIDDSSSYEAARLILNALSPALDSGYSPRLSPKFLNNQLVAPALIYLVANKTDLVRGRQISTEDGRHLASVHDAKFIEVSASLNHLVADLFFLLVAHLRESEQRGRDPRLPTERRIGYHQPSVSGNILPGSSAKSGGQGSNTFRIPSSTKSSLTRFFKKHFTKTSEDSD